MLEGFVFFIVLFTVFRLCSDFVSFIPHVGNLFLFSLKDFNLVTIVCQRSRSGVGIYVPQWTCGSQRTALWSHFFPSFSAWVPVV